MDGMHDVEQRNRSGHERAAAVVARAGGFVVVGETNSRPAGAAKAWVLEFEGRELTPRRDQVVGSGLGHAAESHARAVAVATDGGLRMVGEALVAPGRYQPWAVALAADGTVAWERLLGAGGLNGLTSVVTGPRGELLGGGVLDGAAWLVRLSASGELLGERTVAPLQQVTALAALPQGRVAVAGFIERSSTGPGASAVLAFDRDERPLWQWQPPADRQGDLVAVAATADDGLIATGRIRHAGSQDWGLWVVRLDSAGLLLWEHLPKADAVRAGHAVIALPDGDFVVAGDSLKDLSDRDAHVWRFAADGALRWDRAYGGAAQDLARGLALLGDGSLLVAGSTMSRGAGKTDLWLLRLSEAGEPLGEQTFGAP